jgi:hypothetical protein
MNRVKRWLLGILLDLAALIAGGGALLILSMQEIRQKKRRGK